ncbi:GTP pyrophosphokinase family protein [Ornithinibacillus sp. L9]|uniref:GTP pyrophosphokinase family protein n=1 Tax=Ornithinibacillus caprae TaxID=2678566 RepID=A0A6N8FLU8_9BACI|nr:GTP pyrophosphokinase family protein [Ornithinibacillus caprae]MUK88288.1 GTP pyrophosphokinase family protein [Ornithinibacillus caprae]
MEVKTPTDFQQVKKLKTDLIRFMMSYKFALDEINTKIDILSQEFKYIHDYNPIEHVKSRVKSPDSLLKKVERKGYGLSLESIQENIRDIAGVRITCSFISDIYEISNMLQKQKDITVIECKDYIEHPKPNGYRSLHLIVQIPIFMSDRVENVYVEIQIRTIAMDFWASLEHKIYYKYNKEVPQNMLTELKEAAESATQLDKKMEGIHQEISQLKDNERKTDELYDFAVDNENFRLPYEFLKLTNK